MRPDQVGRFGDEVEAIAAHRADPRRVRDQRLACLLVIPLAAPRRPQTGEQAVVAGEQRRDPVAVVPLGSQARGSWFRSR